MNWYVCFHGHFYQPSREDPWLEVIELQPEAAPYHDWNERITAECYGPNAMARRQDPQGRILSIIDNYEGISFNFGPTLLSWLKKGAPLVYEKILEADRVSLTRRQGHGNAIAQVYNHIIMPLANSRDKLTQVIWGIEAFKFHFGRRPEGMWLAETAVDNETLAIMAQAGIRFTILSPRQAQAVRPLGKKDWTPVDEGSLDIRYPYRCFPKPGLEIDIFFYHPGLAHGIAFGPLLQSGDRLVRQMEGLFSGDIPCQLVSVATDGETYGHHHRFAEMALSYALEHFENHPTIRPTNFAHFLSLCPPRHEVTVKEGTSWGCVHGVDRWFRDCGCNTGRNPSWSQQWRTPLREALNWLRDEMDILFEEEGSRYLKDPWEARNDYIHLILRSEEETKDALWAKHRNGRAADKERVCALRLLEMQYHAQMMFTSCAWFFDDISGLEVQQNLRYAARAMQLAKGFGLDLEGEFISRLKDAKSNLPKFGDGARIYQKIIRPHFYDLRRLSVHFGFHCLIDKPPLKRPHPFYTAVVEVQDLQEYSADGAILSLIRAKLRHNRTEEAQVSDVVVFYRGYLTLKGGVIAPEQRTALIEEFKKGAIDKVEKKLGDLPDHYGAQDIFLDDRIRLSLSLMEERLTSLKEEYRRFYEHNKALFAYLHELHVPMPEVFTALAHTVLQERLYEEIEKEVSGQSSQFTEMLAEARSWGVNLAQSRACCLLRDKILEDLIKVAEKDDPSGLTQLMRLLNICEGLFPYQYLWEVQNVFWKLLPKIRERYGILPPEVLELGKKLGFVMKEDG